jgi:hypothetical protein
MKRVSLNYLVIAALLVVAAFTGCKKDKPEQKEPVAVVMVTSASVKISAMRGTGKVIIDWGDGESNEGVASDLDYSHSYSGVALSHTIIIYGGNIASLHVGHQLTSLDVSRNTTLTQLWCSSNQLTSLDVSKNTALTYLDCRSNQLTNSALNALFETLHSNPGYKTIYIQDNPGTNNCDQSIATNKEWTVRYD